MDSLGKNLQGVSPFIQHASLVPSQNPEEKSWIWTKETNTWRRRWRKNRRSVQQKKQAFAVLFYFSLLSWNPDPLGINLQGCWYCNWKCCFQFQINLEYCLCTVVKCWKMCNRVEKKQKQNHGHTFFLEEEILPFKATVLSLSSVCVCVSYPPLHLFALTTCFIIVCGETAAYQWTACDGSYHRVEHVDRKSQQCCPTVDYSFIHVILRKKKRERERVKCSKVSLSSTGCYWRPWANKRIENEEQTKTRFQLISQLITKTYQPQYISCLTGSAFCLRFRDIIYWHIMKLVVGGV